MATLKKTSKADDAEILRLKKAKKRDSSRVGENPFPDNIDDEPNGFLDAEGVRIAQKWADEMGLEKLKRLFPDMAKLLDTPEEATSE